MNTKWFVQSWTLIVNAASIVGTVLAEVQDLAAFEAHKTEIIVVLATVNAILRFKTDSAVTVNKPSK